MSLSDRRNILLGLALLPLAGCGFAPAYGTNGVASGLRGRIHAADPTNRNTFQFVKQLESRLGRPQAPVFDLGYSLQTSEDGLAITTDQQTTRFNVIGKLDFTLTDRRDGTVALRGSVNSFTGYSATGTTVSTRTAQQDAYDRLMVILADKIVTRLIGAAGTLAI